MSLCEFKEPKFKKRVDQLVKELPIPIDIIDRTNNCYLQHFSAYLSSEGSVYVKDREQAEYLYKNGCFGKGEFSRGDANLNVFEKGNQHDVDVDVSVKLKSMTLMTNERYGRHKEWSKLLDSDATTTETFHEQFLKEFLENKAQLLDDDCDRKPKCKVEFNEKQEDRSSRFNRNQHLLTPNFDPFSYIIKDIPNCIVNEYSYFMHEEAFFLSYALGCLKVYDGDISQQLSNTELWQRQSKYDKKFVYKYIVYHKLRSKGWVLRNGIKYGCDFLAYYKGPEYYHASYSIIVKNEIEDDISSDESLSSFAGLVRVNETASKEVMICYVVFNDNNNDNQKEDTICSSRSIDLNTPECIHNSGVCEILVNRWVPEQNRMEIKQQQK